MPSSLDGASMRAHRPILSRLATLVLSATMALTAFATVAPQTARAATAGTSSTSSDSQTSGMTWRQRFDNRADRVIQVARNQAGDPYRYGAAGPNAFDCSGLVLYVFQHALGKSLPHNAAQQYRQSTHITRSQLRRGDLVFVVSGGSISHVGIYAGHGYWWVAPHSGTRVHRQKIYNANFKYGRLIHPNR